MTKDVDLNSRRWLELVFEGRNKNFGAYELRESSSQRHILAIGVVVTAILALVFLPKLVKQPEAPPSRPVAVRGIIDLTDMNDPIAPKVPMTQVVVQAPATPTLIQRTIGFSEPVIVSELSLEAPTMLTQGELTNSDAAIGTTTNEQGAIVGVHPDDPAAAQNVVPAIEEPEPTLTPEIWPKPSVDLIKWLGNNIRYPVDALESGIEGRVTIRFVVQVNGTITNVEVLQRLFPSCDREAMRVVNKMPKWIPGSEGGKVVAVYYTLPIYFRIQK